MSAPYYSDDAVTLWHGDALTVLRELPDGSVDCCLTSPPYFGLRDYGVDGQLGLEASPGEYVESMRVLFAEVRRVLADDGTLWLNLADTYYSGRGASGGTDKKNSARRFGTRAVDKAGADWAKPKDLLMIPAKVAIALQEDGWYLRKDIIWAKPNPTPDSVADRPTSSHEHVFLLAKSRRYFYDGAAIAEPSTGRSSGNGFNRPEQINRGGPGSDEKWQGGETRNARDVWTIPVVGFPQAHFATMTPALAERCVAAGCKPGGTVLDPFSGAGTSGQAAGRLGRRYVGIELNADSLKLSLETRLAQATLLDGEAS